MGVSKISGPTIDTSRAIARTPEEDPPICRSSHIGTMLP